jgi:hypothetical protein
LNGSTGAVFFLGVSEFRLNISTSALLFFVPSGLVGSGYLVFYSSWRCSGQLLHRLCFVVAQAAGIAGFIVTAQQKV